MKTAANSPTNPSFVNLWNRTLLVLTLAASMAAATLGHAEAPKATKPASPEFERLKALVGTWKGNVDMGQGPVELVSQYRLIAGGTILEERCFVGTPNEMVTMFYEKDGKLALTHYCMMGNRPAMVFKSADSKSIRFEFDKACGIDTQKESHMSALTLTFVDSETISASCKAVVDGKELPENPTTLKRVKS